MSNSSERMQINKIFTKYSVCMQAHHTLGATQFSLFSRPLAVRKSESESKKRERNGHQQLTNWYTCILYSNWFLYVNVRKYRKGPATTPAIPMYGSVVRLVPKTNDLKTVVILYTFYVLCIQYLFSYGRIQCDLNRNVIRLIAPRFKRFTMQIIRSHGHR